MTEQELYIWLLECDKTGIYPSDEFNPKFLNNYEIAKLFLEKIGLHTLKEYQQRNLNFEAVSTWFNSSRYIELMYDIPKILELLPERIVGHLNLENSQIQTLPQLESVGGDLNLENTKIQSLPKLESVGKWLDLYNSEIQSLPQLNSVGGYLNLENSQIQTLPQLESVGGDLNLRNTKIQSLPKLESVRGSLFLRDSQIQALPKLEHVEGNLYLYNSQIQYLPELKTVGDKIAVSSDRETYWRNYFRETGRSFLAEKVTL